MRAVRIYGLLWLLVAGAAGIFYLNDSFTFVTTMLLGFGASVLAGAGLLVVYPVLMTERVAADRSRTR